MAGDDMPAELVTEAKRALEVEPRAFAPQVRARSATRFRADTSTANQSSPLSTTVRHTPEQAIDAPRSTVARS